MKGKNVLLCITGGIASYKMPNLASRLVKEGYNVHVIMSENACQFITPKTFEALTKNPCITDTFEKIYPLAIHHIQLAEQSDYVMVSPATANIIGKMAHGIADDMITSTLLACRCPIAVVPSMNSNMYENPIVQNNIEILRNYGYTIIEPSYGYMACGSVGKGKMPEPSELYEYIEKELAFEKDMKNLKVLITAGATQEAIDPVRYITNHSSGKMGYALAKNAMLRGAEVTLITGHTALSDLKFIRTIKVTSAEEMYNAVVQEFPHTDILVKSAAVADYTPLSVAENKMKKSDTELSIPLKRTRDILQSVGNLKQPHQFICGFSMETENMVENSLKKLKSKNLDMIVANNLKTTGAGFSGDTNVITIITKENITELPIMTKLQCAEKIFDTILNSRNHHERSEP